MAKVDGREYLEWDYKRGASEDKLNRIPHITTVMANGKRYYSTVDAELYFGNIYIDEVTNIQWTINQNTLPLFGYNSYCFDDIAIGTRLIQGTFSINYTRANYLGYLQSSSGFNDIARRQYGKDMEEGSYYSDYRKRLNLPKWDKGFDIVIGFGHHHTDVGKVKENETSSFAVLDCCQITGSSQGMSYVGEPVQEIYTFIARDIKYTQASEAEKNPSENNGTDSDIEKPDSGSAITLRGRIDLEKSIIILSTSNKAEFKGAGKISLTYNFNDKTLNSEMMLSPRLSEAHCSMSAEMSKKIISELEGKNVSILKADYEVSITAMVEGRPVSQDSSGNISLHIV